MSILKRHWINKKPAIYKPRIRPEDSEYNWERDFPVTFKNSRRSKNTVFRLEFSLSEIEILEFYKKTDRYVNGSLLIEIQIDVNNVPTVSIIKSWKGAKQWFWSKTQAIAEYIVSHISFTYIPAIRTEEQAIMIIQNMLSSELAKIETDPDYIHALKKINDLQEPILDELSLKIKDSLLWFIPSIKLVSITNSQERTRRALRAECEIYIDDGNKTKLEYKWDGVKSLVTLSLLKDSNQTETFSLIAIEEPESHLHPWAIHILRKAIYDLATSSQIIISTHNPLFVHRDNLSSNIIISEWNAKPAVSVQELRDILWIRASDNLINASYVLVVEGISDSISLKSILSIMSPIIQKALEEHILIVSPIKWASKLSYNLHNLRNSLCSYYVVLDNDESWKQSCKNAIDDWYLEVKNYTLVWSKWWNESEFEDILDPEIYSAEIFKKYFIDIKCNDFNKQIKWSKRMETIFVNSGKIWNEDLRDELKILVAKCVEKNPKNVLSAQNIELMNSLVRSIELMISSTNN